MKNLSLILASLVLFAGVSFASPVVKHVAKQDKAKTSPKTEKKADKSAKKTDKKAAKADKK